MHRYLVITRAGREMTIDITFPGDQPWDESRSMCLACGDGRDFPAGDDPDADKTPIARTTRSVGLAGGNELAHRLGRRREGGLRAQHGGGHPGRRGH